MKQSSETAATPRRPRAGAHTLTAKPWPAEVAVILRIEATSRDACDKDIVILEKRTTLPFIPRKADELAVGWEGDYMTVETVFWCPQDGITVWFENHCGLTRLEQLSGDGWRAEYKPNRKRS